MKPIPKTWVCFDQKQTECFFETELQQLPKHSVDGQSKYSKLTLKSMNEFFYS